MNISAPFIRRPVGTALLTAAIALAGAVAYLQLPVAPLPQVDFPTISVGASLPGASPEIMASSVAAPLERQLGHIAGVNEMTSSSTLGSSSITLQFDLNRDINGAARDVQAAINAARANLPANLPSNPTYRKVNPADAPILILALTSDIYDRGQLYDAASTIIQQKLLQIEGVGSVNVGGGALPAVRVDVNPTLLNSFGLSLTDVSAMLAQQNANLAKGQLADDQTTLDILANDQLLKAADYKKLIVAVHNGAAIRLSDVANVQDSVENVRAAGYLNGKPAIPLIILRQPGANIIDTVDRVKAELPSLKASIPAGIKLDVVLDRTTTIRASVREIERTLLIAICAGHSRRVYFSAQPARDADSRRRRAGFADRHVWRDVSVRLQRGQSFADGADDFDRLRGGRRDCRHRKRHATSGNGFETNAGGAERRAGSRLHRAVHQRFAGGGVHPDFADGRHRRPLVPRIRRRAVHGHSRLAGRFADDDADDVFAPAPASPTGRARKNLSLQRKDFYRLLGAYERSLTVVLRHPAITLTTLLLTIALNIYLFVIVPKGFFPQQDNGTISGGIQGSQDASFPSMQSAAVRFVRAITNDPAVQNVVAFTGGGGAANSGFIFMALKPLEERKVSADQIIARLRPKLGAVPGASLFLQAGQDLRIGGRQSSAQYQYTIQSENLDDLVKWGPILLEQMKKLHGFTEVNTDQQNNGLQASLVYDRATAARLGISPQTIDQTLYQAFGQAQVSTMYSSLNQYHVVMEAAPQYLQGPQGLDGIYLHATNSSAMVPLSAVAHYEPTTAPIAVNHQGQFPSVTLSFNLVPGFALSDAVKAIQQMEQQIKMPETIHGSFAGTLQAFQQSLATEPFLILAALIAVYIVLGMLYESYIHPITILSTLPSAGVGAVLALLIFKTDLSIMAVIGVLLLIGIVKKNAIMMVDFALAAEREEGKNSRDAIFQACLLRFRPILMTTMSALFGALPLILSNGTGSELRRPLGITIVGGLIMSQALTLYTTPVVYLYLDRLRLWWERMHDRKIKNMTVLQPATIE